jgi:hypothetical protein
VGSATFHSQAVYALYFTHDVRSVLRFLIATIDFHARPQLASPAEVISKCRKEIIVDVKREARLWRVWPLATERDGGLSGSRYPVGAVLKEAAREAAR